MRGDLSDTGLETVFGDLSRAEASGALHLEGRAGSAKVFLRDGDVYYASSPAPRAQLGARLVGAGFIHDDQLDRALAAQESGPGRTKLGAILVEQGMVRRDVIRVFVQEQILDAVFDLARWDQGEFEFFQGDAVADDLPVQIPVGPLLMEVRRRLSEWADIGAVIPSLDAVPEFISSGSTTRTALEPDEFTLLTNVDGRRSIQELAHDLGYSQFDAARLIYGLSLLGVIAVPDGQGGAGGAEAREDLGVGPQARDEPVEAPSDEPDQTQDRAGDEVDVGRALDEALFGMPYEEGEENGEQPTEPPPEPPSEQPPEQPPEPPSEQPVGADDLEPEVWSASIDADDVATEDVAAEDVAAEDVAAEDVATEPKGPPARGPAAGTTPGPSAEPEREREPEVEPDVAPHARAGARNDEALADARKELIALVGELQGEPDEDDQVDDVGTESEAEDERAESAPGTGSAAEAPGSEDLGTVAPPPPDRSEPEPRTRSPASSERTERGDVSELLRELSRLAGGGPEPVAPSPDEPRHSDEDDVPDGPDRSSEGRPEDGSGPGAPSSDQDEDDDQGADEGADESDHKGDDKRSTFRRIFGSR